MSIEDSAAISRGGNVCLTLLFHLTLASCIKLMHWSFTQSQPHISSMWIDVTVAATWVVGIFCLSLAAGALAFCEVEYSFLLLNKCPFATDVS